MAAANPTITVLEHRASQPVELASPIAEHVRPKRLITITFTSAAATKFMILDRLLLKLWTAPARVGTGVRRTLHSPVCECPKHRDQKNKENRIEDD
jgi:hypothetical protein